MIDRYNTNEQMRELWSDYTKYNYWYEIECAVANQWSLQGDQYAEIELTLPPDIVTLVQSKEERTGHEMTAFIDALSQHCNIVTSGIVPLHLGLTSSDVMDTALSYTMAQASDVVYRLMGRLEQIMRWMGVEHQNTLCVGRTHGQHAIPMHFADRVTKYRMSIIDLQNMLTGVDYYGKLSGPIGTHNTISESMEHAVLEQFELKATPASTQIVPRYSYAQVMSVLAIIATQCEKIATDIRLLSQPEIYEVTEGGASERDGSSSMPHKKNPISCEKICSLARMVRANATVAMENMITWFERDLTNSANERICISDSYILVTHILETLIRVFSDLDIHTDQMRNNALSSPDILSAAELDNAIKNGARREDAYRMIKSGATQVSGDIEEFINKNYFTKSKRTYKNGKDQKEIDHRK